MGVFCTDRLTGVVLGLSNRRWRLLGQSLAALQAPQLETAFVRDGYVPSWLARSWGAALFDGLGDLQVVCRPLPERGGELRPLAVYRSGSPAALEWARRGEQLSAYDLPLAPVLLHYAQFCSAGTGHTVTTLRPPAPATPVSTATPVSAVAARAWQVRSGLFPGPGPTRRSTPEKRPA